MLLRDDKSFPYILIATEHEAPELMKHRGARESKGDYFGPFASAVAVKRTINIAAAAFLLRSCSDSFYESRTRPCMLHQIKRCSAPCTGEIALADYAQLVEEARQFLRGRARTCAVALRRHDAGRRRDARLRARRACCATGSRRWRLSRRADHQPRGRRGGRRLRRAPGGRPVLRPGLLLPRLPELGQPRLLPARRPLVADAEVLRASSASSTTTSRSRG